MSKSKKRRAEKQKEWPGDLGKPIVIPFPETKLVDGVEKMEFRLDGLVERLRKLGELADYYGVKREGDAGWAFLLAFQLACDLHPGFQFVFDDPRATLANRMGASFPTVEGIRPHHRPKGTGWAPVFSPQVVALLADTVGKALKQQRGWTDKQFCEEMAASIDPKLEKPGNRKEKNRRVATLIRRLTEGRKLKRAVLPK
jgi:hypothetical protein